MGFSCGSNGLKKKKRRKSACSVGDPGSIPGLGRSPGEGHGNPLQYHCLENITKEPGRLLSIGLQSIGRD